MPPPPGHGMGSVRQIFCHTRHMGDSWSQKAPSERPAGTSSPPAACTPFPPGADGPAAGPAGARAPSRCTQAPPKAERLVKVPAIGCWGPGLEAASP
eukprot:10275210-Alexandrium_andersonii.AAC.1